MLVIRAALTFFSLVGSAVAPTLVYAQAMPSDHSYATRYDLEGRVTGTIAPDPDGAGPLPFAAVRNTFNERGLLVSVEQGSLATWQSEAVLPSDWTGFTRISSIEFQYDLGGRKVREAIKGSDNSVANLTQYSYTASGQLECTAVRMNAATFSSAPASACVLGIEGAHGADRITRNVYNAKLQVAAIQKAVGTILQQDYVHYTYTPNGHVETLTDANGAMASRAYDVHDRLLRWNLPSKTTADLASDTDFEEYGYDPNGNRTSLRRRDGRVLTFAYDALNRMTHKLVPDGCAPIQVGGCPPAAATRDVYYGYDLTGLQTYARFDSETGEGVATSYDGLGQRAAMTQSMSGVTRTLSFEHDLNGNRVGLTFPDAATFGFVYDGLDRLNWGRRPNLYASSFDTYDAAGRVSRKYNFRTLGYDAVGRLNSMGSTLVTGSEHIVGLTYNPANQSVSRTQANDAHSYPVQARSLGYTVNGLNQYTEESSAGYAPRPLSYDANGNLISDGTNVFTYDAENRLLANTATGATLSYDPLGRLWQSYGVQHGTTRFLYDGDALVAEYDGSGNLLRRYIHGQGVDEPRYWFEGVDTSGLTGTTSMRALIADERGSVVWGIYMTGATVALNRYDEYGVPAASNTGRFQYTGQAWLPEFGLYYYKARIYSPTLGRFLQTDPIGYDDQLNLYAYVANDPVNMRDPTGMDGACIYAGGCTPQGPTIGSVIWNAIKNDPVGVAINVATAAAVIFDIANSPVSPTPDVGAAALAARAARIERLQANAVQGARGEAATAARLGDRVAGRQVTFRTSDGTRTRADFVTKGREVVETKTGGARLSTGQEKLHGDINAGRPVTPVGQNARDAGLRPGEPIRMKGCSVDRPC